MLESMLALSLRLHRLSSHLVILASIIKYLRFMIIASHAKRHKNHQSVLILVLAIKANDGIILALILKPCSIGKAGTSELLINILYVKEMWSYFGEDFRCIQVSFTYKRILENNINYVDIGANHSNLLHTSSYNIQSHDSDLPITASLSLMFNVGIYSVC